MKIFDDLVWEHSLPFLFFGGLVVLACLSHFLATSVYHLDEDFRQYYKGPYTITVESITPELQEWCNRDDNCMDIELVTDRLTKKDK